MTAPLRQPRLRVGDLTELVGNTPLMRLHHIERGCPGVELWAKCEFTNPAGSVKDRAALRIIQEARTAGVLRPGMRLIDSTSGNTGIAYAMVGAALGVPVTLVMPENVSVPRKQVATAYGVEIIYSSPMEGSDGAIRLAKRLVTEHEVAGRVVAASDGVAVAGSVAEVDLGGQASTLDFAEDVGAVVAVGVDALAVVEGFRASHAVVTHGGRVAGAVSSGERAAPAVVGERFCDPATGSSL